MLKVFLLSTLFTFLIAAITFPLHMGCLLYYFPEEIVDMAFFTNVGVLWLIIFLIFLMEYKREKRK